MTWLLKPQKIYMELVTSRLRLDIARLTHVLASLEETNDYTDEYIHETIKTAEYGLRSLRKFIQSN